MIELSVEGVMSAPVRTVTSDATVRGVTERLAGHGIGSLVVVDVDGPADPVGMVTESDVVRAVATGEDPGTVTVEAVMSAPVVTVAPDTTVHEAARRMKNEGIRRIPVVENRLKGIVTAADLTHYIPRLRDRIAEK